MPVPNVQIDPSSIQPISPPSPSPNVQIDPSTITPIAGASSQSQPPKPPVPDSLHLGGDPTTLSGGLHNIAAGINSVGAGIGSGILDTMGGAVDMAHKLDQKFGINPSIQGAEQKASDYIHGKQQQLEQQNSENPTLNMIGKGGETLMEFLLGDEAIKALPLAQRLEHAAKTMKILEKSPRMMRAAQIAAEAANTGARSAAVQGVQSGVKSGGDLDEAAKGAATAGIVGGTLGAAGGALGEALSSAGKAGHKIQELSDVANTAAPKGEVASDLADRINSNEHLLKQNYGESLKDFTDRTKDVSVPYKDSPFHKAVQDIIGKGEKESTPFDEALRKSRPGSSRVNQTLEELDNLAKPPEAPEPEKWVDADGVTHVDPVAAPEAEPINMDMKTLLEQRALLGERIRSIKGVSSEDLADKAVYGKLMDGVDNTIDDLVAKAKDPQVAEEYQALRDNYREHVNLYNDPVIKAITNPKGAPDDAARAFIGQVTRSGLPQASKVQRSLNTLQKVLDPLGTEGDKPLKQFGGQVFQTLMKDATHDGNFNASRFMDTWGKIDEPTKERLFDAGKDAQSVISDYAKDAQSVANIQRLTRVGLLGAGALPFHAPGLGLVGLLALTNENAGVHAGRTLLDFIANHPATWKTFRGLGHIADSETAHAVGSAANKALSNAAGIGVTETSK